MGYTHYWYRQKEISPEVYSSIVQDFRCLLPMLERWGIRLAGGLGEGEPHIDEEAVWFNGLRDCGHRSDRDFFIAWPAEDARGIAAPDEDVKVGTWFAGNLLSKRACDGDCSHETFHFPRVLRPPSWQKPKENGLYFNFCKTAFKPYDLAVTAFLVVAKHHLGSRIIVRSDGDDCHWQDAKWLCQLELGYGLDFRLD
jgi:hypothetical protein